MPTKTSIVTETRRRILRPVSASCSDVGNGRSRARRSRTTSSTCNGHGDEQGDAGTSRRDARQSRMPRPHALQAASRPMSRQSDDEAQRRLGRGKVLRAGAAGQEGRDDTDPARPGTRGTKKAAIGSRRSRSCRHRHRVHGASEHRCGRPRNGSCAPSAEYGATSSIAHLDDGADDHAVRPHEHGRPEGQMTLVDAQQNLVGLHATRSNAWRVAGFDAAQPDQHLAHGEEGADRGVAALGRWRRPSPRAVGLGRPNGTATAKASDQSTRSRVHASNGVLGRATASDASAPDPHGGRGGEPATGAAVDGANGVVDQCGHFEPFHTPPYGGLIRTVAYGHDQGEA